MAELPALDTDPDLLGPDPDEIEITDEEVIKGNWQGTEIDHSDDTDNGLPTDDDYRLPE